MADGDYYASYADVQEVLMNTGLGLAGNTLLDDAAIEKVLKIGQAKLHLRLGLSTLTSETHVVAVELLKEMEIDMSLQRIIAARYGNDNNLSDLGAVQAFWTISPTLTYAQIADLNLIKRLISSNKGIFNHNIFSGSRT